MKSVLVLALAFALVFAAGDFSSATYQKQSRTSKLSQLWKGIIANPQSSSFPSSLALGGLFIESMVPSVEYVADSMPKGRRKYVHSVGSAFTAKFVAEAGSPYTGLFTGADSLVLRFSLASEPDYSNTDSDAAFNNFIPALAVKYLIDGRPSENIFAMPGVDGIHSFNYLSEDFNTHIGASSSGAGALIAAKFSQGTDVVQVLGTRGAGSYTQNGAQVANAKFPWKLSFRATDENKNRFTANFTQDYSITLSQIPVGTVLFDVFAIDNPEENCEQLIGTIVTSSIITTSLFGDEVLFYQHPDFNKDLESYPQWVPYTPFQSGFATEGPQIPEGRCPFGF